MIHSTNYAVFCENIPQRASKRLSTSGVILHMFVVPFDASFCIILLYVEASKKLKKP